MRLWIIRHAKSDSSAAGQSDFDRPLNARGRRDGPAMAEWLAEQELPATWVWSSPARRAAETATYVSAGFAAAGPEVIADRRLYLADAEHLLDVLRETPAEISAAAVVAHNPGLTELVNALVGRPLLDNLPTFGVAVFAVDPPWQDLGRSRRHARLLDLMTPKRLAARSPEISSDD
ncbi:MAG: SixA phosphatase family protein [Gammaproteobacteria bacterium]